MIERLALGVPVVVLAALSAIIVWGIVRRWWNRRWLRKKQEQIDKDTEQVRVEMRKRRHAEVRAEYKERLRKEREEQS